METTVDAARAGEARLDWVQVARLEEVPADEVVRVEVGGESIALYNLSGVIHATHNICTHDFALLSDGFFENATIECPLHQACFDVTTGKRVAGYECADLRTFPVKIENEMILIGMPAA